MRYLETDRRPLRKYSKHIVRRSPDRGNAQCTDHLQNVHNHTLKISQVLKRVGNASKKYPLTIK